MTPSKAEPERPATTLSREERLRAEDIEVSSRIGEEFGLGEIESVSRTMNDPSGLIVVGGLLLILSLFAGLPVGISVGVSSASPTAKLIVVAIFCGMFVLGWPLVAMGVLHEVADNRVALYSGGVAQLRREEPEPNVLRWADIETVTIELTTDEGTPETGLASCTLRRADGTGITEKKNPQTIAAAAHRALGPRLAPPLIETYDRGEPVTAGDARIDQEGFTMGPGKRLAWSGIKSVTMRHATQDSVDVATRIDIRVVRRNRPHYFDPSGIPNAIFSAHVLARAAMRNGVQVDGYHWT
jgi:hypothetical protein